jgi:biopolymer transport protein ExbD
MLFEDEGKPDLTPMIDMVFQLIIFFMVVSDFASIDHENVVPPKAIMANDDDKPDPDRMIMVSVLPDGKIKIMGKEYDKDTLTKYVGVEAQVAGTIPNPDDPGKQVSKLRVVIRADRNVDYEHVQKVFEACSKNGVFRTSISALKEEIL